MADQDRPFAPFTDCEIDGSCGSWHKRDHRRLVAFAEDPQGAVPAAEAEVADVGLAGFARPGERGTTPLIITGGRGWVS